MGLQLYFSHRLEDLAAELARRVAAPAADPALAEAALFTPLTIVHPNRNMKRWLQVTLARLNGVAMNLQFRSWDEEIEASLRAAAMPFPAARHLLDQERLRWFVLRALVGGPGDAPVPPPGLARLRAYVGLAPAGGAPAAQSEAAKAWQLSGQLARLIRELELHRPDWTAGWREQPPSPEADSAHTAVHALYHQVFTAGGLRDRWQAALGERWHTLPGWVQAEPLPPPPAGAGAETPLHIFALPQWSAFHRGRLFELAQHRAVHLYCLNLGAVPTGLVPSSATTSWLSPPSLRLALPDEEWEPSGEAAAEPGADALTPADLALGAARLWNRVGVEGLQLLATGRSAAPAAETQVHWLTAGAPPTVAPGLLGRVQRRLLDLRPTAPVPAPTAADCAAEQSAPATLQLARCPSVAREVEAVYHCILRNLVRDADLRQSDVLVLVPDMAVYRPAIHAAFDRGDGYLGYTLGDLPGAEESVYAQAVTAALQLAEGRFTRAEVFGFLQNPCVAAALQIDRPRLITWGRWAEALNVFANDGAAGEPEAFTWRQALRRLQLGRVMEAPPARLDDEDPPPPDFHGAIPYADADSADREELDRFVAVLAGLETGVRALTAAGADAPGWLAGLQRFLARFVAVPAELPQEASVQMAVGEALARLQDNLQRQALAGWPQPSRLLLGEAVRDALATLESRQGRYLAGGVTLSTQYPLRPIPFKLVFVLGLDEHNFPNHPRHAALDPRRRARRPGDADETDLQRLMFLEAVLSARERLYLSYVSRDLQKDEERLPCGLLMELLELLPPLTANGPPAVTVPLHSHAPTHWQPAGFERLQGESPAPSDFESNFGALDRRLAAADAVRQGGGVPSDRSAQPAASPPLQKPAAPAGVWEAPVTRLARFWRQPLDAALQLHLALPWNEDAEEEALEADTEPFFLAASAERAAARAVAAGLLSGEPRAAAVARGVARVELLHRLGAAPAGGFHQAELARLRAQLQTELWVGPAGAGELPAEMAALLTQTYRPALVFGDARQVRRAVEQFGPIHLAAAGGCPSIRLHGRLMHVFVAPDATVLQVVVPDSSRGKAGALRPLFETVLLTAGLFAARAGGTVPGLRADDPLARFETARLYALWADKPRAFDLTLDPATAARALTALVQDWVQPGDYADLPWVLVEKQWKELQALWDAGGGTVPEQAAWSRDLERAFETAGDDEFSGYMPTAGERLAAATLPVNSAAVALRRFELLLRLRPLDGRSRGLGGAGDDGGGESDPTTQAAGSTSSAAAGGKKKGGARGAAKKGTA